MSLSVSVNSLQKAPDMEQPAPHETVVLQSLHLLDFDEDDLQQILRLAQYVWRGREVM